MQLRAGFLYQFFLQLALATGVLSGAAIPVYAQSMVINVDKPELAVNLLNRDGSFNQNATLCTETQEFSERLSPEAASIIAETRCRSRLLSGAAYNLRISPLFSSMLLGGENPNFENLAQSLSRIVLVEQIQPSSEPDGGEQGGNKEDSGQQEDGEKGANPQPVNQIQINMELTPAYADLSTAIKAGITDSGYQRMVSQILSMEKDSLEKIEEGLPSFLSGSADTAFLREQVNRLSSLRLCRQHLVPPKSEILQRQGRTAQVEQAMNQAAKLDPANPAIFTLLGENQINSGRTAQAAASFTQALKLNPEFLPALAGRGTAYLRLNLIDLALEDYNKVIGINPESPAYYMARAAAWLIKEDFQAMCKDFRSACGKGECEGYHWAVERKYCQ